MKKRIVISALMALAIVVTPVFESRSFCRSTVSAQNLIEIQAKLIGWNKKNGKWYYNDNNGKPIKSKWMLIDDRWFYFNSDGTMHTGWLNYKGRKYYLFPSSGVMVTGCVYVAEDKKWHNFNSDGELIKDSEIAIPYYMISSQPIHKNTTLNDLMGVTVPENDVILVTSFDYTHTALGTYFWGEVNYEGKKSGWIMLTNNRNLDFAKNDSAKCKQIINKKFKYDKR